VATRTKRRREVLLPWERSPLRLAELLSSQRWKTLLLAAAVIGALAVMWKVAEHRARVRVTEAAIAEVHKAIAAFRADVGRCPRSTVELVHPPRSGARYLSKVSEDGWGNTLFIRCPSREDPNRAEVVSAGPSGSFLIDDNIY
jgi:hypothetical protein